MLNEYAAGLRLNQEKTKVVKVQLPVTRSAIAERIKCFKFKQSGPLTVDVAVEMLNIDSELWNYTGREKKIETFVSDVKQYSDLTHVKDESIARMTVYNWRRSYRALMEAFPYDLNDTPKGDRQTDLRCPLELDMTRESLDVRTADFCDQVFERWYKDPSQVRIMKVAIDLMPNELKIARILDLLLSIPRKYKVLKWHSFYVLSELYRAVAVELWSSADNCQ